MNSRKFFLLAVLSSVLVTAGCDDASYIGVGVDSPTPDKPDPDQPEPDQPDPDQPDPDQPDPDQPDPEEPEKCTDQCETGQKKCDDNAVWSCQMGELGCLAWTEELACVNGEHCNEETNTCKAGCYEICEPGHLKRCNEDKIQKCVADENGCAVWELEEQCSSACDRELVACPQECTPECALGEKACRGNGVAECVDPNNTGCPQWGTPKACSSNQKCDESTAACVSAVTCKNECEKGAIKAGAASSMICKDVNGDGCYEWAEDKKCNKGEKFDAAKNSCVSVCGSSCKPFSIVFLPDTQEYVRNSGAGKLLEKDLKWIHDNYKDKNIVAVLHHGDMTDTNTSVAWEYNNKHYKTYIDSINLPYLPTAGNHDYLQCASNSSAVKDCSYSRGKTNISNYGKFNNDRFANRTWFGDGKGKGFYSLGNSYMTFTASGIKFLVISMEFLPRKDTICWAENLISSHKDHKVIITTHAYLNSKADDQKRNAETMKYPTNAGYAGRYSDATFATGADGSDLYKNLASRHNNIILVTSGHINASTFRFNKGNQKDHFFAEMIVDYQEENIGDGKCEHTHDYGGGGGGWMRILTFDPAKYTITASTVTPVAASSFKGGAKRFFCNGDSSYPKLADTKPSTHIDPKSNPMTRNHAFVADYDFVTPVDYEETDGSYGHLHRTVNTISNGNQETPAVSMKGDTRDYVVVWADDAYNSDGKDTDGEKNMDIRARILCSTGCNKVSQFTVNKTTAGNQKEPDVAMDIKGNFVVVWTNAADNSVYMRKLDITAKKEIVAETKVNTSGKAGKPTVAIADDGSYVVTWQSGTDIYMRGFDANGKQTFAQTAVSTANLATNGKRNLPDIAMDKNGNFVITWEDDVDGDGVYNIAARGFDKSGKERIKEFIVNSNKANQERDPSIGMNRDGVFYIVWEDDTDGNKVYRARMRAFNANGSQKTADTFVSRPGENAADPVVCVRKDGEAYFSWAAASYTVQKKDGPVTYKNVNVRTGSKNLANGDEYLVTPITAGIENQPAIACSDSGRYVIAWHDDNDGNNAFEVMSAGF